MEKGPCTLRGQREEEGLAEGSKKEWAPPQFKHSISFCSSQSYPLTRDRARPS